MEKIKVLIVEDQLLIAEDIASKLVKHSLEVAGTCGSGEEAIEMVEDIAPDLILMDINLSGAMDGISTARVILDKYDVPIIYLSEYVDTKTIDRAKKTMPAAYLSKPFQEADLIRSIDLAFSNARAKREHQSPWVKDHVFLRSKNQYIKLHLEDIIYLEADRSYCYIVTEQEVHTMTTSMNHVYEQLNNRDFMKIHRSFVININKITALDGNIVRLGGEKQVQMSKDYRDELMSRLKFIK
ncbi:MAG TPA: LytTR family transcriptional regulator DNA-binding domain-containing protein [Ohtaekwangia sp.]|uniref:LytR/AlgR family response regulator transcription factor n=1 Tax=Ohtaekwangia sp. TaxID=2066019 RepID=UPI002F933AF9